MGVRQMQRAIAKGAVEQAKELFANDFALLRLALRQMSLRQRLEFAWKVLRKKL